MKHFLFYLCLLIGISISTSAMSTEVKKDELSGAQKSQLTEVMYGLLAIQDLQKEEIITKNQGETATEVYLAKAQKIAPGYGSMERLITIDGANLDTKNTAELSTMQKLKGLIAGISIMKIFFSVLGVICFLFLFGKYILLLAVHLPAIFYESILYIFSFIVIWYGHGLDPISTNIAFIGCLLLAGAVSISSNIHKNLSTPLTFFILFMIYSGVTVWFMSSLIGFIAIIALMGALGFSGGMTPGCIFLGFKDDDAVGKGTTAGFIILSIYCISKILGINNEYLTIFQSGSLFMGSFVGYLGLLIASSRWYGIRHSKHSYPLMLLITTIAGILAILIGSIWNIGELQKIGGTFFGIFILEKIMEIPAKSVEGYALLGLIVCTIGYRGFLYIETHLEIFGPYVFF